jgi:RNA polymerase sigma factor (sigma-70 family)
MPATTSSKLAIVWSEKIQVFETAFNNFWDELYRHTYRKTQAEDVSKDLVQEAFIVLWDSLDNLKGPEEILPFLYGTLRNKTLREFEKSEIHLRYTQSAAVADSPFDASSENLLLNRELEAVIAGEVTKMPVRMKEIYILKKEENFSIRQIAEKLGLSEQTVKNQLQSAYGRLRSCLKDYNSPIVTVGFVVCYMPLLLHC